MHPASPAAAAGVIHQAIRASGYAAQVTLDVSWIFVQKPGFTPEHFGDVKTRHAHLGKWIVALPAERLVPGIIALLPLVHDGRLATSKLTNVWNYPKRPPQLYAYCLERDAKVLEAMQALGKPRWKYNHQTFGEIGL